MKAFLFLLLGVSLGFAEEEPMGKPLKELPAGAVVTEGALSLWADYAKAAEGVVPLYVINASRAPVTFDAQDGDIYVKLEYKDTKGVWQRAQPHRYSWCGNSYFFSPKLDPGTFMEIPGLCPAKGEKADVRYRCYGSQDIYSNVGAGFYDPMQAAAAEWDAMALRTADLGKLSKVARGTVVIPKGAEGWQDARISAMRQLERGEFDRRKVGELMLELSKDPDPQVAELAKRVLESKKAAQVAPAG